MRGSTVRRKCLGGLHFADLEVGQSSRFSAIRTQASSESWGWQGTAAYAGGTRLWGLMPHPRRRK